MSEERYLKQNMHPLSRDIKMKIEMIAEEKNNFRLSGSRTYLEVNCL